MVTRMESVGEGTLLVIEAPDGGCVAIMEGRGMMGVLHLGKFQRRQMRHQFANTEGARKRRKKRSR